MLKLYGLIIVSPHPNAKTVRFCYFIQLHFVRRQLHILFRIKSADCDRAWKNTVETEKQKNTKIQENEIRVLVIRPLPKPIYNWNLKIQQLLEPASSHAADNDDGHQRDSCGQASECWCIDFMRNLHEHRTWTVFWSTTMSCIRLYLHHAPLF